MKALISGGAGFVGSHLVDSLVAEGHQVTVVDDLSNGSTDNIKHHMNELGFKFMRRDISNQGWINKVSSVDVVYHLACWPRSRSFTNPRRDVRVNLLGAVNILEYARGCGARVVFSSNSGIYDSSVQPIREGNPEKPTTPYDVDKLASEHMIKAYAQAYGFPYTIFRFATVYGPRQRVTSEWNPVISTFLKTLKEGGRPYITGDGSQTRDFIYVADIVDALIKAKDMKGSAGPILLGSGCETSIKELYDVVQDEVGVHVKPEIRPRPLGEILRMSYDCALARRTLGWVPIVDLEKGVRETAAQF